MLRQRRPGGRRTSRCSGPVACVPALRPLSVSVRLLGSACGWVDVTPVSAHEGQGTHRQDRQLARHPRPAASPRPGAAPTRSKCTLSLVALSSRRRGDRAPAGQRPPGPCANGGMTPCWMSRPPRASIGRNGSGSNAGRPGPRRSAPRSVGSHAWQRDSETRPCVVVSPDELNQYLRTVIVAPMTTAGRVYRGECRAAFSADQASSRWTSSVRSTPSVFSAPSGSSHPKPLRRSFEGFRRCLLSDAQANRPLQRTGFAGR